MGFGSGFVTGLASSFDKALQLNNKNIMDSMSKAETYMYERRAQEDKRMREKADEYEDTIKDLANYVDTTNLPKGVTATDVAGAWLAKSGGSLTEAKNMLGELQKSRLAYGDEGARLIFTKAQSTGMSARDIGRTFVRPPDLDYIRGPAQKRKTLFGGDIDITARAAERVGMPTDEQTRKAFDTSGFEGLSVGGKLFTKTETTRAMEKEDVALKQARLTLQKTEKEIADMGGLDETAGRMHWKETLKNSLSNENIGWDSVRNEPDFKTIGENVAGMRTGFAKALQATTNYFNKTGTTAKQSGKNQLLGFAVQNTPYIVSSGSGVDPQTGLPKQTNEIGKVYSYSIGGKDASGIWLGDAEGFLTIPGF